MGTRLEDKLAALDADCRLALLTDRTAATEATQNLLIERFLLVGEIVYSGAPLATKYEQYFVSAARWCGYRFLQESSAQLQEQLVKIAADSKSAADHEFAMNNACHCVDMLMALVFADACLQAHIIVLTAHDEDTEQVERAQSDLQDIGENYQREMRSPAGLKVLQLLKADCNYIQNRKSAVPAGTAIPWFLV